MALFLFLAWCLAFDSLSAKAAAHSSWVKTPDRAARTARARAAAEARIEKLVDPDGLMTKENRAKAVANARKLHPLKMSQAAKAKREQREQA
jgi:hypothetical protein